MRITIIDDHALFADALKIMLESMIDKATATVFSNIDSALSEQNWPDLFIIDLKMPDISGIDCMKKVHAKKADQKVAIISGIATRDDVYRAMNSGALAFFPKTLEGPELVEAIKQVVKGQKFTPRDDDIHETYQFNAETRQDKAPNRFGGRDLYLTGRENDVMRFLLKGASNKEIARELDVSVVTVKLHVGNICQKLDVKNRTQAALRATELGLISEADMR